MKQEKHPSGKTIIFQEYPHSYFIKDKPDATFRSVTQIGKKYKNKFDADTISKNYAKKHNKNRKHVLAEWADKGKVATALGNSCHAYAESLVTGIPIELNDEYKGYYKQIKQRFKTNFMNCDELKAEYIVGLLDANIAGTLDLLKKDGNKITIVDWKTNKEIKSTNIFKKMLPPFQLLDDCNLNTYRLQLNIYRYILKKENYFPYCNYEMWIYHVKDWGIINIPVLEIEDALIEQILFKGVKSEKMERAEASVLKRYPELFKEGK